jgi:hypothetical protein
MIRTVAENVESLQAGHSVDLSKPDRTIIIQINKVRVFLVPFLPFSILPFCLSSFLLSMST